MYNQLINAVVAELRAKLDGRFLGKIFQLSPFSFAFDFGLRGGHYLFISVQPASPRFYLIHRRVKDLEKQSMPLVQFGQMLRAKLGGAELSTVEKDPEDRVVRLKLRSQTETGSIVVLTLVVQLTGKAANLLLLDETNTILQTLRPPKGGGQNPGETYCPPPLTKRDVDSQTVSLAGSDSPSAAADNYFQGLDDELHFKSQANDLRNRLRRSLSQKRKLRSNLQNDLQLHGDPEGHKRIGDLLLANAATAIRDGNLVKIVDYYSDEAPTIEVEVDESSSLQEEASRRFSQYTKAKRAGGQIKERLAILDAEISDLEEQQQQLETIILDGDKASLAKFGKAEAPKRRKQKEQTPEKIPGVRQYLSTDGYQILVGRAARDNDNLTFRVAGPNDLWLHAGDYPGSHVIVRNPTRKEIPHRTIIEAAQLAGKFSQAGEDTKVVVHYTQRKFLAKPKGAAAGLVRMSAFKSITVEPKEAIKRIL
ncbi:MAG TPA: NFACT family protein [Pyrinomonadaceae bacterium]